MLQPTARTFNLSTFFVLTFVLAALLVLPHQRQWYPAAEFSGMLYTLYQFALWMTSAILFWMLAGKNKVVAAIISVVLVLGWGPVVLWSVLVYLAYSLEF